MSNALVIPTQLTISNNDDTNSHSINLPVITKNSHYHLENSDNVRVNIKDFGDEYSTTISFILSGTEIQKSSLKEFIIKTLKYQIRMIPEDDIHKLYNTGLLGTGYDKTKDKYHALDQIVTHRYDNMRLDVTTLAPKTQEIISKVLGIRGYYQRIPTDNFPPEQEGLY